jgi:peptide deformylase
MASRGILGFPHPLLSTPSRPIFDFDARAKQHMKSLWTDLRDTAAKANAPALSAVQIGAQWAAIYVSRMIDGEELFLVNPVIIERSPLVQEMNETCASLPGIELKIKRSASLTVAYRKVNGDEGKLVATGNLAQCLGHELQHLYGKTLFDCAHPRKRYLIREHCEKISGPAGSVLNY